MMTLFPVFMGQDKRTDQRKAVNANARGPLQMTEMSEHGGSIGDRTTALAWGVEAV